MQNETQYLVQKYSTIAFLNYDKEQSIMQYSVNVYEGKILAEDIMVHGFIRTVFATSKGHYVVNKNEKNLFLFKSKYDMIDFIMRDYNATNYKKLMYTKESLLKYVQKNQPESLL